jgi:hypothetical protein
VLVKKRIIFGTAIIFCIIAGVYLYAQYNPEDYSFFPQCPVYALTGYQCPGCGSQRAFYHLFHGHIQTAFLYNPLMIALAPYIILGVYLVFITDPMQPIAVRIRHIFFGKWALFTLAVIVVGYTIIRNL